MSEINFDNYMDLKNNNFNRYEIEADYNLRSQRGQFRLTKQIFDGTSNRHSQRESGGGSSFEHDNPDEIFRFSKRIEIEILDDDIWFLNTVLNALPDGRVMTSDRRWIEKSQYRPVKDISTGMVVTIFVDGVWVDRRVDSISNELYILNDNRQLRRDQFGVKKSSPATYKNGDKIEYYFIDPQQLTDMWLAGIISEDLGSNRYTISTDDDRDIKFPAEFLRLQQDGSPISSPSPVGPAAGGASSPKGLQVEYLDNGYWYVGTVTNVREFGVYDMIYFSGETRRADMSMIRPLKILSSKDNVSTYNKLTNSWIDIQNFQDYERKQLRVREGASLKFSVNEKISVYDIHEDITAIWVDGLVIGITENPVRYQIRTDDYGDIDDTNFHPDSLRKSVSKGGLRRRRKTHKLASGKRKSQKKTTAIY